MKFKLTLHKEFEIDTDKDWGGDLDGLLEMAAMTYDPGSILSESDIHDTLREMLAEDIDTVVDLELDETCFKIEVPEGTTIELPKKED